MSRLWMDHVIYAVDDLDAAGAALFDREGLASVPGGRHEGWGTANRIVPLGESYLELIAVVDVEEAEQSEFGRAVRRALTEDHPLVGWVVATDDIDAVAEAGSTSRWRRSRARRRTARRSAGGSPGLERAMKTGALPFFVQWDVPAEQHPGAADVRHEADPARNRMGRGVRRRSRTRCANGSATTPTTSRFGSPTATRRSPPPRSRRAAARSCSAASRRAARRAGGEVSFRHARRARAPRARSSGRTSWRASGTVTSAWSATSASRRSSAPGPSVDSRLCA